MNQLECIMYNTLSNQRVVITGINGGIAKATAALLLEHGAEVVATARTPDKLDSGLSGLSGSISGVTLELTDPNSIAETFANIGAFDHLVTPAASAMLAPIAEMDFNAARQLIDSKQMGQMLCVHHGLKQINRSGSVTLFSGTVTQKPLAGASVFAAVGAATEAAARVWAFESAPVRFNTVVPGVIDTAVWDEMLTKANADEARAQFAAALPVGRIGTALDVAKAVLFLIDNGFVNGTSVIVDGGHRLI